MKILFYIEPLPIRNSSTHFGDIAKRVARLISQSSRHDLRLFANAETIALLPETQRAELAHRVISVPDFLIDDHIDVSMPWDQGGIDSWLSVIKGADAALPFKELLAKIWHQFHFDVILTWGENGIVSEFAKEWGATHIAMELGCTRAPYYASIVLDPFGTNGASLPSKLHAQSLADATRGSSISGYHAIQGYSAEIDAVAYEQFLGPVDAAVRSLAFRRGKKIAFLPLQLYDDANLLAHSPYGSLSEVLADAIPKLVRQGYFVIVKPHPDSRHRPNASFENALARASIDAYREDILWLDDNIAQIKNTSLFAISDVVVTVNSSVGFEALYHDMVVVVLGAASYKVQGVFPTLEDLESHFDTDAYLRRIGQLRSFMLEAYLVPNSTFEHCDSFCDRVSMIVGAMQSTGGDPALYAAELYAAGTAIRRFSSNSIMNAGISTGANDPAPAKKISFSKPGQQRELPLIVPGLRTENDASRLLEGLKNLAGSSRRSAIESCLVAKWQDEASRRQTILRLGLFDKPSYEARNIGAKLSSKNPLTHFIQVGELAGESPRVGINLGFYKSEATGGHPPLLRLLINLLNLAAAAGRLSQDGDDSEVRVLEEARREIRNYPISGAKIAVIAHLFYADLVGDILDRISQIQERFDLIVSLPAWGHREMRERVVAAFPDALIITLPNKGRDIGPFIELVPFLLSRNYDACLKVHSKKGYYTAQRRNDALGEVWRRTLLDGVIGSAATAQTIIEGFRQNSELMMVGASDLLVALSDYPRSSSSLPFWEAAGDLSAPAETDTFFAGTMFWVRPRCLQALAKAGLSLDSFEPETGSNDGAIAHDLERYFGHLAATEGYVAGFSKDGPLRALTTPAAPIVDKLSTTLERLRRSASRGAVSALMW